MSDVLAPVPTPSDLTEIAAGAAPGPLAPTPLVDRVLSGLQARIGAGEFAAGARLPSEKDLASHYVVSRPIVREALRLLRNRGLVFSRRGSGTFVTQSVAEAPRGKHLAFSPMETVADVQRCYEFRLALEPEHTYWAALRWNAAALERIRTALDALSSATRAHAHREDADFAFHLAIAEASNNHYHVSSLIALKDHISIGMKMHGTTLFRPRGSLEAVFQEHAAIYEAIRKRDAAHARDLMAMHLRGSRDRIFDGHALNLAL
jgi:GntR family transcriptional regulator, transcriptional repressor for pyruvate dehydrogenase complex